MKTLIIFFLSLFISELQYFVAGIYLKKKILKIRNKKTIEKIQVFVVFLFLNNQKNKTGHEV